MANSVYVPGAALIRTGTGSSLALEDLGYTVDGVEITEKEFGIDVKSDRYGGSQGQNIDYQILGLGAEIKLELVEITLATFLKLQSRMPTNSTFTAAPGKVPYPGTLTFGTADGENGGGGLFRTLIIGAKDAILLAATPGSEATMLTPRNYPFCRVKDAIGYNLGTRHAKASVTIEAYMGVVSGNVVCWNRVST